MRVWLQFVEPLLREIKAGKMPVVSRIPHKRGRTPVYVRCPQCPAIVTSTEARRGHDGCPRKRRPYREPVACRYCGKTITATENWKGHEGCTRAKRRYTLPGRGKWKQGKIISFTKEEIAAKIAAMSTGSVGAMCRRIMRSRGTGRNERKRAD